MLRVKQRCRLNGAYSWGEAAVRGFVAECCGYSLHDVGQAQVCVVECQLSLCAMQCCKDAEEHLAKVVYIAEGRFADWLGDIMPHDALQYDSCTVCMEANHCMLMKLLTRS